MSGTNWILSIDSNRILGKRIKRILEENTSFEVELADNIFIAEDRLERRKVLPVLILVNYQTVSNVNTLLKKLSSYTIPKVIWTMNQLPESLEAAPEGWMKTVASDVGDLSRRLAPIAMKIA